MVVDITGPADRGRTVGILQGFSAFGHSVSPLLGGILTGYLGFQAALTVCAGMTALGYLIALLALPETRPSELPSRCDSPGGRQAVSARAGLPWLRPPANGSGRDYRQFLGASYVTLMHAFAGYGILMSTVSLYLQRRHGDVVTIGRLPWPVATVGGGLLALWALLSAAVALPAGHLSDCSGSRWTIIACGSMSGAAGMAALAFGGTPLLMIAGVALVALRGGAANAVLPAVVGDLAPPERRGLLQGGLMTMEAVGSAAAPLVAYALVAVFPLEAVYLVSAAGLATGLALPWVYAGEGKPAGRAVDETASAGRGAGDHDQAHRYPRRGDAPSLPARRDASATQVRAGDSDLRHLRPCPPARGRWPRPYR